MKKPPCRYIILITCLLSYGLHNVLKKPNSTPFGNLVQVRLNGLATFIGIVGLSVALVVLVALLVRYNLIYLGQ